MPAMRRPEKTCHLCLSPCGIAKICVIVISCCQISRTEKIRYAIKTECDRYSLDAIYHEKYKPVTYNIFADSKEFVSRVSDLVTDSLISVMAQLPGRDSSDDQEKKVYTQFRGMKRTFSGKVKSIHKNITSSWEDLLATHFDLMFDNSNASLKIYENKTARMADSYSGAHHNLDKLLSNFVSFIKATVRDGLLGIEVAAEQAIKTEEEKKKMNQTEGTEDENLNEENKDDRLRTKMEEISKMIVPGFLGKVTVEVIKRKLDLKKEMTSKVDDRDNPLDDIEFDMLMIKNRIRAIVQLDVPKDKGAVDLARRSIYTYWADLAEEMYRQKLESAKNASQNSAELTGRLFYRNLWKDEEQIVETLLDLMEVYS